MADNSGSDIKHSGRLSEEQRQLIEKKVRAAKSEHKSAEQAAPVQVTAEQDARPKQSVKHFEPMSDEQRKLIAEKIQYAKEQRHSAATAESPATKIDAADSSAFNDFALINEQQREAMMHKSEERRKIQQHEQVIRKRLLSMAGKDAVIDEDWPYNDVLMDRGQTWNSFEVNVVSGPDMVTERSVARLWRLSPTLYSIAAGYALDAGGTWHKHSWLIAQHKVQEVKLKYAVYYGVILTAKESELFGINALGQP